MLRYVLLRGISFSAFLRYTHTALNKVVLGLINTTPKEFENGDFTLKTHEMFSVHTMPEELKNATITSHFRFVFEENSCRGNHMIIAIVFEKLRFQFFFRQHENVKPVLSISSGLKNVFE